MIDKFRFRKVKNFLCQMGATPFSGNLNYKRKYRKIVRMAKSRERFTMEYWSDFELIYRAFNLHEYTSYGMYWVDFRKAPRERWFVDSSKCRVWSLNGPVRRRDGNAEASNSDA